MPNAPAMVYFPFMDVRPGTRRRRNFGAALGVVIFGSFVGFGGL